MESPDISEESKGELLRRRAGYNPEAKNRGLKEAVVQLLRLNREKSMMKKSSVRRMAAPRRPDFGWVFVSGQPPLFDQINY
jgi:hypothetical protein